MINDMFWGDRQEGKQRGFIHQAGDIIEEVFRPTVKRQELLLQQIISKLDRDNSATDSQHLNGKQAARIETTVHTGSFQVSTQIVK